MEPEPAPVPGADVNPIWGPDWPEVRELWPLEPTVAHLNHGSFGAVPTSVLEEQASWRDRMEINPVRFFTRELSPALELAREEAAAFLGLQPDAAAFVPNATIAANTVLASLPLTHDDAVLITDHGYGAVRLAAERWAGRAGARVQVVPVPLAADDGEVERLILQAVTSRTRLVVVDQVASPSARAFPVEQLVPALAERGVPVFVDGAHAPGMLPVDVGRLGADFWCGNFHKWGFAPRGTAMLAVAPHWRSRVMPLAASWREPDGFPGAFEDQGTADPTAWLSLPRALRFLERLDPDHLRAHNHALVRAGQRTVAASLGLAEDLPAVDPRVSMALVPLPDGLATDVASAAELQSRVGTESGVEVSITTLAGRGFLRLSAQAYNCPADYARLAEALPGLVAR